LKIRKNGENENPRNGFAWNSEERRRVVVTSLVWWRCGCDGIYIETQREEGKRGSWEFLLVPARKIINKKFGNEL
jgi:hypothetical protein